MKTNDSEGLVTSETWVYGVWAASHPMMPFMPLAFE